MSEGILASIIAGGVALLGNLISGWTTVRKTESSIKTGQAILDVKFANLEKELNKHNDLVEKIPYMEEHMHSIDKELEEIKDHISSKM